MLQALTNHNPDVIFVDELSDASDVRAARSIGQRGVALVATAHAKSLAALLSNPELRPLVGDVTEVILSDQVIRERAQQPRGGERGAPRAFHRGSSSKTQLERRGPPIFQHVVELLSATEWRIHWDVAASVDALLAQRRPAVERRALLGGRLFSRYEGDAAA